MKKKILALGIVVALVAALAIPMAALAQPPEEDTTEVSGNVTAGILLTAPSPINLGMMVLGDNSGSTSDNGSVGSNNPDGLTVTVHSNSSDGTMAGVSGNLTNPLMVDTGWGAVEIFAMPIDDSPQPCLFYPMEGGAPIHLSVSQWIVPEDVAGVYSIILTYTAYLNFP